MDKTWCIAAYALLILLFWWALWIRGATGRAVLRDIEREHGWLATQKAGVMLFGRLRVLNYLRTADWKRCPEHRRKGMRLIWAEGAMWLSCAGLIVMVGWGHRLCAG